MKFDLNRKARYLGGGHLTQVSLSLSYSSVVSRDSVRIMFLVAVLKNLDIKMCDIGNAYLNAETRERLWFTAGQEWGSRAGYEVIIVRALYVFKKVAPNRRRRSQVTSKIPSGTAPALEQTIMCTFEQIRMKTSTSTIATLLSMLTTFCIFIKTPSNCSQR